MARTSTIGRISCFTLTRSGVEKDKALGAKGEGVATVGDSPRDELMGVPTFADGEAPGGKCTVRTDASTCRQV